MRKVINIILAMLGSMLLTAFILSFFYFIATGEIMYLTITFTIITLIICGIHLYNVLDDINGEE